MLTDIICAKCNGRGFTYHYGENEAWSEMCVMCDGTGKLGKLDIDDVDMISIPRQEYEELLEYKHMYEDLCK